MNLLIAIVTVGIAPATVGRFGIFKPEAQIKNETIKLFLEDLPGFLDKAEPQPPEGGLHGLR